MLVQRKIQNRFNASDFANWPKKLDGHLVHLIAKAAEAVEAKTIRSIERGNLVPLGPFVYPTSMITNFAALDNNTPNVLLRASQICGWDMSLTETPTGVILLSRTLASVADYRIETYATNRPILHELDFMAIAFDRLPAGSPLGEDLLSLANHLWDNSRYTRSSREAIRAAAINHSYSLLQ